MEADIKKLLITKGRRYKTRFKSVFFSLSHSLSRLCCIDSHSNSKEKLSGVCSTLISRPSVAIAVDFSYIAPGTRAAEESRRNGVVPCSSGGDLRRNLSDQSGLWSGF